MPLSEGDLRERVAAWNAHDAERVATYFTDDARYEDVAMGQVSIGRDEIREFAQSMFRSSPDIDFELLSVFVGEAWFALEWVMTGTQTGDQMSGLPATGKPFSIRGASVGELAGDKIKRNSDYWSLASLMQQLGVLPAT